MRGKWRNSCLHFVRMVGFLLAVRDNDRLWSRIRVAVCCGISCIICSRSVHAVTPTIYGQPLSQAALAGSNAVFVVSAGTSPLAYQWRFNGGNVSGATNSTLTITNVQPTNTGAYVVVVTNSSGAITSPPAVLSLTTAPDFLWARQVTNGVPPSYGAISGARHVAADNSGNLFVAGTFNGSSPASIDFGGVALTNVSSGFFPLAAFVCKFDRFGNIGCSAARALA